MSFTDEEAKDAWELVANSLDLGTEWDDLNESYKEPYIIFANALQAKYESTPIEPKNIRVGDEIEGACVNYGVHLVASGAVSRISEYGNIYTKEGGYIGNIKDETTFRLIHRPVPKLEVGQVIRVDEVSIAEANGLVGREFSVVYIEGNVVDVIFPSQKWSCLYLDDITAFTVLWPTEESK